MSDTALTARQYEMAPQQSEYARGWRALVASALGIGLGMSPLFMFTSGVFAVALEAEFGWSRGQILGAALFDTLSVMVIGPMVGRLNDKIGARPVAIVSCLGIGLLTMALALTTSNIWTFYAIYAARSALSLGTLPPTFAKVINAWFDKKRGMALGIALCTTGVSGMLLPPYVQAIIGEFGWRAAYVALGALPLLIALPAILFLLPKGGPPIDTSLPADVVASKLAADNEGQSVGEALRGYRFWLMAALAIAAGLGLGGILSNLVPLLVDRGFTPASAAAQLSLYGFVIIVGRLVSGWLLDRFWAPAIGCTFLITPAIGMLLLASGADTVMVVSISVVLIALSSGAEFDLVAFLTSRYFGRKNFSALYAVQYASFGLGAGMAPAIFGSVYDRAQSYAPILYVAAVLFAVSAAAILTLGRYPTFGPDGHAAQ